MNEPSLAEAISKAALLGVERQIPAFPVGDDPLGIALSGLNASERDAALFGAAALNAVYRQAGQLPTHSTDATILPCELEDQPRCSPRAEHYLAMTLTGEYKELLPEWLDAVAMTNRRVSERHLPDLLEAGRTRTELRERISAVLGKRGRWLASLNPEWNYAQLSLDIFNTNDISDPTGTEDIWQSAGRAARASVLMELRKRDPERARALIESTWAQDGADERAAFAAALKTNLTLADEPFLEKALDDRGKDVRRAAADLLSMLPGSRLSQRMIERIDALITIKRNLIGQASLEVRLPETHDKAMERDSITEKSPFSYLGEKAWWLTQIIAAVPLDHWTKTWKKKPEQCILIAASNEWTEAFILGWGKATHSTGTFEWAEALSRYWAERKDRAQRQEAYLPSLASLTERGEAIVIEAIRQGQEPLYDEHPAFALLQQWRTPWSETLARLVISSVKGRVPLPLARERSIWQLTATLPQFARLIPPELTDELTTNWPEEEKKINNYTVWPGAIQRFCTTLQIRHDMLTDIRTMKETDTNG